MNIANILTAAELLKEINSLEYRKVRIESYISYLRGTDADITTTITTSNPDHNSQRVVELDYTEGFVIATALETLVDRIARDIEQIKTRIEAL